MKGELHPVNHPQEQGERTVGRLFWPLSEPLDVVTEKGDMFKTAFTDDEGVIWLSGDSRSSDGRILRLLGMHIDYYIHQPRERIVAIEKHLWKKDSIYISEKLVDYSYKSDRKKDTIDSSQIKIEIPRIQHDGIVKFEAEDEHSLYAAAAIMHFYWLTLWWSVG